MSINKKFDEIVDFALCDVDELGDDIILKEDIFKPRGGINMGKYQTMGFPFGSIIVNSVFQFFFEEEDEEDENGEIF